MNKQIKFRMRPILPGTYVVRTPDNKIDIGTRTNIPINVGRKRSSGTHFPFRFSRMRTTILSEIRPERGAPTTRTKSYHAKVATSVLSNDSPKFPTPTGIKHAPMSASLVMLYCLPCAMQCIAGALPKVSGTHNGIRQRNNKYYKSKVSNRCDHQAMC
jgi:hypothetical protein